MTQNYVDICIIGQGLAGTSLAWELHRKNYKLAIFDRSNPQSSSRVAAGLITPITGKRFVKDGRFDHQWETAIEFYRSVENETDHQFLSINNAIRIFSNTEERERFLETRHEEFAEIAKVHEEPVKKEHFSVPYGGFEMNSAARLDVTKYLESSREYLSEFHRFYNADLNLANDLKFMDEFIEIPKLEVSAKRIVFCEGFSAASNPYFEKVPFDSAKGEILTIKINGLDEPRVVHCGIWFVRIAEGVYRVGATYDRESINLQPTTSGRDELCLKLSKVLKLPFEVIDHTAGIRPIIVGRNPKIGFHPKEKRLGYFNGLGSKGSLQAPWFAKTLAGHIMHGSKIPPEYDIENCFS